MGKQVQPAPVRSMFVRVPMLTGYASVRHVEVSRPIVEAILDGEKYYIDRKRLEGTESRRGRHRDLLAD